MTQPPKDKEISNLGKNFPSIDKPAYETPFDKKLDKLKNSSDQGGYYSHLSNGKLKMIQQDQIKNYFNKNYDELIKSNDSMVLVVKIGNFREN